MNKKIFIIILSINIFCSANTIASTKITYKSLPTVPLVQTNAQETQHLAYYIGDHVATSDYQFQETMRCFDLALKEMVATQLGDKQAQLFFTNGWGQVIAGLYLAHNNAVTGISDEFQLKTNQALQEAMTKASQHQNPFYTVNVRALTKLIMMHPHAGSYYPFKKAPIDFSVQPLNELLAQAPLVFSINHGKLDLDPTNKLNFFATLWATDFPAVLTQQGYQNMHVNNEKPHLTLLNSNVLAQIKEAFVTKYGQDQGTKKCAEFLNNFEQEFNTTVQQERSNIKFTEFNATYSEDYTPFGEVVVGRLQAPCIHALLNSLVEKVRIEVGITIKVQDSFHVTLAIGYRKPLKLNYTSLDQVIAHTGFYADDLQLLWQQFCKS